MPRIEEQLEEHSARIAALERGVGDSNRTIMAQCHSMLEQEMKRAREDTENMVDNLRKEAQGQVEKIQQELQQQKEKSDKMVENVRKEAREQVEKMQQQLQQQKEESDKQRSKEAEEQEKKLKEAEEQIRLQNQNVDDKVKRLDDQMEQMQLKMLQSVANPFLDELSILKTRVEQLTGENQDGQKRVDDISNKLRKLDEELRSVQFRALKLDPSQVEEIAKCRQDHEDLINLMMQVLADVSAFEASGDTQSIQNMVAIKSQLDSIKTVQLGHATDLKGLKEDTSDLFWKPLQMVEERTLKQNRKEMSDRDIRAEVKRQMKLHKTEVENRVSKYLTEFEFFNKKKQGRDALLEKTAKHLQRLQLDGSPRPATSGGCPSHFSARDRPGSSSDSSEASASPVKPEARRRHSSSRGGGSLTARR